MLQCSCSCECDAANLLSMEPSQTPFDEKSALEELERLRDAIQAARRARMAKSDEFDAFVNGFKTPPAAIPEPPPAGASRDEGASQDAPYKDAFGFKAASYAEAATGAPPIDLPTPAPVAELLTLTPAPELPPTLTSTPEPADQMFDRLSRMLEPGAQRPGQLTETSEPPAPTADFSQLQRGVPPPAPAAAMSVADLAAQPTPVAPRRYPAIRFITIFTIAALALIAVLIYWSRGASPRVAEAPANDTVRTPAPAVQEAPVAAPPPAAPAPVANVNVELRTLQPVWMRVTVDGQKQREGTVPAGESLQLHAERAIIVRAGNGADVVVKTATGETPLGVAGQPITFTFTKAGGKS